MKETATAVIITAIVCAFCVSFVLPLLFGINTTIPTQWIHRSGVVLLGSFLASALYFQIELYIKRRTNVDITLIRNTIRRWRGLTEFMPGIAAGMIAITGFSRLYFVGGYSLNLDWIFVLVCVLAVMMSDGIFGYTPAVRDLLISAERADNADAFFRLHYKFRRDMRLLIHSLSFPFVVVIPIWKITRMYEGQESSMATNLFLKFLNLDRPNTPLTRMLPAIVLFVVLFLIVGWMNGFGRNTSKEMEPPADDNL